MAWYQTRSAYLARNFGRGAPDIRIGGYTGSELRQTLDAFGSEGRATYAFMLWADFGFMALYAATFSTLGLLHGASWLSLLIISLTGCLVIVDISENALLLSQLRNFPHAWNDRIASLAARVTKVKLALSAALVLVAIVWPALCWLIPASAR